MKRYAIEVGAGGFIVAESADGQWVQFADTQLQFDEQKPASPTKAEHLGECEDNGRPVFSASFDGHMTAKDYLKSRDLPTKLATNISHTAASWAKLDGRSDELCQVVKPELLGKTDPLKQYNCFVLFPIDMLEDAVARLLHLNGDDS